MPQARQDETPEYPFAGPFGGFQSEVSTSQVGNAGFADCQNIVFRNASLRIVPEFAPVIPDHSPDGTPVMGIWDFFDKGGGRHCGVFTRTGMYEYTRPAQWANIPIGSTANDYMVGQPLTGLSNQFFQTAVVGYKLYFCQGSNNIQFYDGGFTPSTGLSPLAYFTADSFGAVAPPPGFTYTHFFPPVAQYLMELDFHLVAGYGFQSSEIAQGSLEANKVCWSAAGDGTDWYTFSSGSANLFNNLGPITGMTRLYQTGYIFQRQGVTQAVPTGNALQPFNFVTMGAYALGNTFRYSLASFGERIACYVGRDDIYVFDGTSSQPIGQHPIDGNRRLGARTRIMADLWAAQAYYVQSAGNDNTRVWSVITTAANGITLEAYWLLIPELNKAWVYNFDESNWAQLFFQPGRLQGPAASQFWAEPNDFPLPITGYKDSLVIADNKPNTGPANTLSYLDFSTPGRVPTSGSINASDGWYIRSGELDFDDNRHPHTVNKIRMVLDDVASPMTFYIRLFNEVNYVTPVQRVTLGEASFRSITLMIDLQNGITGKYISWELSGPPGVNFQLVEITPYPILGGEVMTRCEVSVMTAPTVTVTIIPGSASIAPGATQQFNATVSGSTNQSVVWTASDGTITAGGLFTAPSVTATTVVTITATPAADPNQSSQVNVSIQPLTAIAVHITPNGGVLTSAGTMQFSATVTNTINVAVTWTATPGTISSTGLYNAPPVTTTTSATITATSVADPTASAQVTVSVNPAVTGQIDVLTWCTLNSRSSQHLVGDPSAPYAISVLDTDAIYPAAFPRGYVWFIKNKLGHPWDIWAYDDTHIGHWITENGDSADQAACQSANGTTCWMYERAYKRHTLHPAWTIPRYLTPGVAHTENTPGPNTVNRTTNCESTWTVVTIGDVQGITSGPLNISWGGSIDKGSGTLADAPNYDNVNGTPTIKNEYYYSGSITGATFKDREEYYFVKGFGRVAWYYYHRTDASSPWVFKQKTVNTVLASGGAPVPVFPCGAGKSWW